MNKNTQLNYQMYQRHTILQLRFGSNQDPRFLLVNFAFVLSY